MADQFQENANKAFETAKLTSYWLYLAGIPEALEYAKLIGLDKMDTSVIPFSEDMCFLNPIIHEIRYKSINYYIRKSGCKNVLDIACGYSPRGMQLAREGYHYYGADLPVVAEELTSIAKKLELDNLEYCAVDATNYESLRKITDTIDGPICIVVEGLNMYLTAIESATIRENIARIMADHKGSIYITTDPGNGYLFASVIMSLYPQQEFMQRIGMLFTMYNWASNGGITKETAKRPLSDDVKMFEESGFKVEQCELLPDEPELLVYKKLNSDEADKLKKVTDQKLTFVSSLRLDKNFDETTENEEFSLSYKVDEDTLRMVLKGRIDTLSVPEILKCFNDNKSSIKKVEIDLKDVTYLASAGTRAFYLIRKELVSEDCLTIVGSDESGINIELDDEIIKRL